MDRMANYKVLQGPKWHVEEDLVWNQAPLDGFLERFLCGGLKHFLFSPLFGEIIQFD